MDVALPSDSDDDEVVKVKVVAKTAPAAKAPPSVKAPVKAALVKKVPALKKRPSGDLDSEDSTADAPGPSKPKPAAKKAKVRSSLTTCQRVESN